MNKVSVPEGVSGDWKVTRFTVTEDDEKMERIRSMFSFSSRGRCVPAGVYTKLTRHGYLVMSDTPDEMRDHCIFIYNAKGHVLINGLGLGVVLQSCLEKPEVTHATVIEKSPDVIALVGTHYQEKYGDRLTIINADALEWIPPKNVRYGAVWHDIWDDLCEDNLSQMQTLHRRYGRKTDWQGSWGKEICKRGY
jgi:hypothetical protein